MWVEVHRVVGVWIEGGGVVWEFGGGDGAWVGVGGVEGGIHR